MGDIQFPVSFYKYLALVKHLKGVKHNFRRDKKERNACEELRGGGRGIHLESANWIHN
jgi:hypothetical protein